MSASSLPPEEAARIGAEFPPGALARFLAALRASPRLRVEEGAIWAAFASAFPRRPSGPEERRWLLVALEAGVAQEVLGLPSPAGNGWDRAGTPALPTRITLCRAPAPEADRSWRRQVWHHALQWVPDLKTLDHTELAFLRRVHEGLVNGTFHEPAPLLHRSLQLTGDEKRLRVLARGRLFGDGRLSLELLGCQPSIPPLAYTIVGESIRVLVFENAGPYDLARRLLREQAVPAFGTVVYGAGTAFLTSVVRLTELPQRPTEIAYVGDLDPNGLRFPTGAASAATAAGLPAPTAAPGFHAAMLAGAAALGHPMGWPVEDESHEPLRSIAETEGLLAFVDVPLRTPIAAMWRVGHRIPEEVLSPAAFRDLLR